jgi:hypothetical protein
MARRNGIEEILRSRRFPGIVSATPSHQFEYRQDAKMPIVRGLGGDPRNAEQYERDRAAVLAEKDRVGRQQHRDAKIARPRDGRTRYVGSVCFREYEALKRQTGDKHIWRNPKAALKRIGRLVD